MTIVKRNATGGQRTCIYCRRTSDEVEFNREHVLPEAFGKFKGALTLRDAVCEPCNSYFSRTLDLELSRKAVEGLERYRWGVKKPEEIEKFNFENIKLRAVEEGDFKGAKVELYHNEEEARIVARPVDGVAIHNTGDDEFTHFTFEQIRTGRWRDSPVDWRRGIRIFGPDPLVAELRAILAAQGVTPATFRPLVAPVDDVRIEQEFSITQLMQRGIAKIAMNYLTFRQGAAFVLLPAFDPIRRFVRYGELPHLPAVHSTWELPFRSNAPEDARPVIHWIDINAHEDHRNLLGNVVLFGFMDHIVMLAENFASPWPDLPVAHIYNPKLLTVSEVIPVKPRWRHADSPSVGRPQAS